MKEFQFQTTEDGLLQCGILERTANLNIKMVLHLRGDMDERSYGRTPKRLMVKRFVETKNRNTRIKIKRMHSRINLMMMTETKKVMTILSSGEPSLLFNNPNSLLGQTVISVWFSVCSL
jgi:hypothetical protein